MGGNHFLMPWTPLTTIMQRTLSVIMLIRSRECCVFAVYTPSPRRWKASPRRTSFSLMVRILRKLQTRMASTSEANEVRRCNNMDWARKSSAPFDTKQEIGQCWFVARLTPRSKRRVLRAQETSTMVCVILMLLSNSTKKGPRPGSTKCYGSPKHAGPDETRTRLRFRLTLKGLRNTSPGRC